MMLTEKEQQIRKEYRLYLRKKENRHSTMLNSMISALENNLESFSDKELRIYDEDFPIQDLLQCAASLETEESLAKPFGYICSLSLNAYIQFIAEKKGIDLELLKRHSLEEGNKQETMGIRYERDPLARNRCIEHYGCKCFVCGFDFEKVYGELGKGFIEVHHIVPISQRGGKYLVDPIRDLRPLCSNCHSMIHRNNETLSIDRLSEIVREMK